ncbi:uncharacterized protein LOC134239551 [Saccostrea cucullata]|uniref:uncharacterized protein LOC134239551 n=1 Tax=Saccostrea cuccullata TaxID=36930 RepID=UPI002ED69BC4
MSLLQEPTSHSLSDMIEVVYLNNEASAKRAVTSFLKMYGFFPLHPDLENRMMHSTHACDPNIIVICSDTSLQDNINEMLAKIQGHQLRMMVIVCPQENSATYPEFNMNSKIKFWTHLTCNPNTFESVPCTENELAKIVFDCFLEMLRIKVEYGSSFKGQKFR